MKHLWLCLMLLLVCVAPVVRADDITVRAGIEPNTVEVGGQVMLSIEVAGKFRRSSPPELPPLPDFDVFEAGTSQNFSFVNGQAHSSVTFSYVLSPRKEGTFKLEPIRISLGDKQYSANPVTLTVVSAGAAITAPGTAPGGSPTTDLPGSDESIFVAASVDRDTVYVNQQVTWTLGYYTDGRVELLRAPNYAPPEAEGFWVEDLPPQNKYYTNLHNRKYLVSEIKRGYFPTAPGTYTVGEARVDIVLDDMRGGNVNDFFNRGLRGGFGQPRALTTKPIAITVLPLPASGKPTGFDGAIAGDLKVSMAVDKQVAQVGQPINVTVELSGTGNMRTLALPKFKGLDTFKMYESGNATNSFKQDYVVSGRRKFDLVLVPQAEGKYTIPAVRIPYFDPVKKRYDVAQSQALPVEVMAGTNEDGRKLIYAGGDGFEVLNRDIRFIHAAPAALTAAPRPFHTTSLFYVLHALPALAVAASLVLERRRRRLSEDVGFARASRALRDAEKRFAEADKAFAKGSIEPGFAAVHTGVMGYLADRMNVATASLTGDSIDAFLRERSTADDIASGVRRVLAACEAARYAAGLATLDSGRSLVRDARAAVAAVEKGLR